MSVRIRVSAQKETKRGLNSTGSPLWDRHSQTALRSAVRSDFYRKSFSVCLCLKLWPVYLLKWRCLTEGGWQEQSQPENCPSADCHISGQNINLKTAHRTTMMITATNACSDHHKNTAAGRCLNGRHHSWSNRLRLNPNVPQLHHWFHFNHQLLERQHALFLLCHALRFW